MKVLEIDGMRFQCSNAIEEMRVRSLYTKEPGTIEFIKTFTSADIFWDIGANMGIYSIFAAVKQDCRVCAFEPHLPSATSLLNSIRWNQIWENQIVLSTFALSSKDGFSPFFYASKGAGSSGSQLYRAIDENDVPFRSMGLEHKAVFAGKNLVFERSWIVAPTVVKIDVDGIEPEIIVGMGDLLDTVKFIQIEVRPQTIQIVHDLMTNHGFELQERHLTANGKERFDAGVLITDMPHNAVYRNK